MRSITVLIPKEICYFHMKIRKRVQNKLHVTLAHVNSLRETGKNKKAWQDLGRICSKNYHEQVASAGCRFVPIFAEVRVEQILVFGNRLVALKVSVPKVY